MAALAGAAGAPQRMGLAAAVAAAVIDQGVKLKYDAFPYQRYGAVDAKLNWISPSAVTTPEGSHFVVNVLAYDQIELSNKFARTHDNKFAEIDHMIPECGAPVLIGAAAHFECRNEYRHYGGDHIIFIGHVERYAHTSKPTLLFCRGKYMRGEPLVPP